MKREIVYLFIIIDVIYFNFKAFLLFEVVINGYLCDEVWIQCVVNDFCLPNLDPDISLCFEKDQKRVRKTESIHVW